MERKQVSIKVTMNERLSIRLDADVTRMDNSGSAPVWNLELAHDALSALIREGNRCAFEMAGHGPVTGKVCRVERPAIRADDRLVLEVA